MQKTAGDSWRVRYSGTPHTAKQANTAAAGVMVGPPLGQSMSSSNINGRVSKTINLMMPVLGAGGRPVAQAQVTQVEAAGVAVRAVLLLADDIPYLYRVYCMYG